jgi:hypothetical protein
MATMKRMPCSPVIHRRDERSAVATLQPHVCVWLRHAKITGLAHERGRHEHVFDMLTCLCHGRAFERVADTLVEHADERAGVCTPLYSGLPCMCCGRSLSSSTPLLWVCSERDRSERGMFSRACPCERVQILCTRS